MATIRDDHGPLPVWRIADLERRRGIALPPEYREFLAAHNGGRPVPNCFGFPDSQDASLVQRLLGIGAGPHDDLLKFLDVYDGRLPADTLPIAHDPCGNLICIVVSGRRYGQIYFWDHELEADYGETPGYRNMTFIAESFQQFLDGLHELDVD